MPAAEAAEQVDLKERYWAEISLSRLRHNYRQIRKRVGDQVAVMAVVKSDAYGHGAVEVARALAGEGAPWFGVSSTRGGAELREAGITQPICVLTGFLPGEEDLLAAHRLTPAIYSADQITRLEARHLPYHVKIDTGMGRLGFGPGAIETGPHMEGVLTHLSSADQPGDPESVRRTEDQIRRFAEARAAVPALGRAPWTHLANSAALATRNDCMGNLVRPGLALYGYVNCAHGLDLLPVASLRARILSLRDVPAGAPIGYGGTHVTLTPARIAVLAVGYANGISRALSGRGQALVRGRRVPMVGLVTMDLTLLDVTGVPGVEPGDVATLIGEDGGERITATEIAQLAGTVPYEVLTGLHPRIPHLYT